MKVIPRLKYGKAMLRRFKKLYIETGSATKAMAVLNPHLTPGSANVIGRKLLKRIDISDILEAQNVTDEVLVKSLKNGLESTRPLVIEKEVEYIPDYKARHKYLETGLKLKGYLNSNQTIIDNRKLVIALPKESQEVGTVIKGGDSHAS